MQPDALGLAFATSVLAVVIAIFGLVSRVLSGPVAGLSYAIGLAVARGLAQWDLPESGRRSPSTADANDAGPGTADGDGPAGDVLPDGPAVVLAHVVGGRPRLRVECRLAAGT